ncbi:Thiamine-phosphate diphosphorylase [Bertholletia excelsa]
MGSENHNSHAAKAWLSSYHSEGYEGNRARFVRIQMWSSTFFLQHTSASLTINENYDSDVRDDTETFLNSVVPEGMTAPWKHTLEGPDDMPAHIKSSMFGCTLTIPITNGQLNMGTWQCFQCDLFPWTSESAGLEPHIPMLGTCLIHLFAYTIKRDSTWKSFSHGKALSVSNVDYVSLFVNIC